MTRPLRFSLVAALALAHVAPAVAHGPTSSQSGAGAAAKSDLKRLSPDSDVWLDMKFKRVVVRGEVVFREGPLELFACLKNTKEHEAIVACTAKAYVVHAALLALGAEPGHPVVFRPEYQHATGPEVEVLVYWKDEKGQQRHGRAEEWIRNVKTGKILDQPWVFGGSGFWKDESTGEQHYMAESGDFICVSNFPSAMLDLPVKSSQSNESLVFECNTEQIPPVGTPVTITLAPQLEKKAAAKP